MTKNSFQKLQTVINSNEQSYEQMEGKKSFFKDKIQKKTA
jgi:hypothetical protein